MNGGDRGATSVVPLGGEATGKLATKLSLEVSFQVVLADLEGDGNAAWIYVEALVRTVRRANPQAAFLGMWFAHGLDHADNTTSFRNTQQQQAPVRAAGPGLGCVRMETHKAKGL